MEVFSELWRLSATELADGIKSAHFRSIEVVEAHLRRVDEVNPSVNAVVHLMAEQALEMARAADRAGGRRRPAAITRCPVHRQ
jgi:amidase